MYRCLCCIWDYECIAKLRLRTKFATTVTIGFYAFAADQTNKETIEWSKRIRTALRWEMYPPTTVEMIHAKTIARRDVCTLDSRFGVPG